MVKGYKWNSIDLYGFNRQRTVTHPAKFDSPEPFNPDP